MHCIYPNCNSQWIIKTSGGSIGCCPHHASATDAFYRHYNEIAELVTLYMRPEDIDYMIRLLKYYNQLLVMKSVD